MQKVHFGGVGTGKDGKERLIMLRSLTNEGSPRGAKIARGGPVLERVQNATNHCQEYISGRSVQEL